MFPLKSKKLLKLFHQEKQLRMGFGFDPGEIFPCNRETKPGSWAASRTRQEGFPPWVSRPFSTADTNQKSMPSLHVCLRAVLMVADSKPEEGMPQSEVTHHPGEVWPCMNFDGQLLARVSRWCSDKQSSVHERTQKSPYPSNSNLPLQFFPFLFFWQTDRVWEAICLQEGDNHCSAVPNRVNLVTA